jgi:uncharacterized DUF497 family protein
MNFEWDENKALINYEKHGLSFNEAKEVFFDLSAIIFEDEKHSINEKREIIIGQTFQKKIILVSFTMRNDKIRIISARLTNKIEKKKHEEHRRNRN